LETLAVGFVVVVDGTVGGSTESVENDVDTESSELLDDEVIVGKVLEVAVNEVDELETDGREAEAEAEAEAELSMRGEVKAEGNLVTDVDVVWSGSAFQLIRSSCKIQRSASVS
jgi:hypothetical protein